MGGYCPLHVLFTSAPRTPINNTSICEKLVSPGKRSRPDPTPGATPDYALSLSQRHVSSCKSMMPSPPPFPFLLQRKGTSCCGAAQPPSLGAHSPFPKARGSDPSLPLIPSCLDTSWGSTPSSCPQQGPPSPGQADTAPLVEWHHTYLLTSFLPEGRGKNQPCPISVPSK